MFAFYENRKDGLYGSDGSFMNFPLHLHGSLELLYLQKGSMLVQADDSAYPLEPGGLAVLFPNRVHGYHTLSEAADTRFLMVLCGQEMTGGFAETLRAAHPARPVLEAGRVHADIPYAMESLLTARREGAGPAVGKAFVQLILARALEHLAVTRNRDYPPNALMIRAVGYLSQHYLEPVTLQSLSRELGVCRYSLSRVFSEGLHMGFCRYVNELRVGYAKNLLEYSDRTMLAVGLDSGFENQRSFNRVFKSLCGVTPLQYKKQFTGR